MAEAAPIWARTSAHLVAASDTETWTFGPIPAGATYIEATAHILGAEVAANRLGVVLTNTPDPSAANMASGISLIHESDIRLNGIPVVAVVGLAKTVQIITMARELTMGADRWYVLAQYVNAEVAAVGVVITVRGFGTTEDRAKPPVIGGPGITIATVSGADE